ncbi:hypothetical protein [Bradyrhizobium sp. USDA 10063]
MEILAREILGSEFELNPVVADDRSALRAIPGIDRNRRTEGKRRSF